jgi:hypothetical protein
MLASSGVQGTGHAERGPEGGGGRFAGVTRAGEDCANGYGLPDGKPAHRAGDTLEVDVAADHETKFQRRHVS